VGIDDLPLVEAGDRAAWRAWLAAHPDAPGAWLDVRRSKAGAGLAYPDAVEEALCFGWIDGRSRPLQPGLTRQHFAPRKPGSMWARSNKERVARLEREGKMTEAGRRVVAAAQRDGSWNTLDDVDALVVPADLQAALAANDVAQERFTTFSPSVRRGFLYWVTSAKRAATRAQRIADTVWLVERGIRVPGRRQDPS
jgi:uncharacterized protein YdeI (YjbR/CyaY-like superfamily)